MPAPRVNPQITFRQEQVLKVLVGVLEGEGTAGEIADYLGWSVHETVPRLLGLESRGLASLIKGADFVTSPDARWQATKEGLAR